MHKHDYVSAHLGNCLQAYARRVHSIRAGVAAQEVPAIAANQAASRVAVLTPLLSVHQVAELLLGNPPLSVRQHHESKDSAQQRHLYHVAE